MPEEQTASSDEKLLILPLGEESKKITQVISNDTARQIIELLADVPLSASDIAERLHTPLTTIVYNLENLENVGLIRVEKIKYSEKGREVKIYAPVRKLIVVIPERADRKSITDILRKYVGVVLAAALASGIIDFFSSKATTPQLVMKAYSYDAKDTAGSLNISATSETVNQSVKGGMAGLVDMNGTQPAQVQPAVAATPTPAPLMQEGVRGAPDIFTNIANTVAAHPGLLFLLGCIFVIVLLVLWDYHKKGKNG